MFTIDKLQTKAKLPDIEYSSRVLQRFENVIDTYMQDNINIINQIERKWLNSQQQAGELLSKYENSKIESAINLVVTDLINDFLKDLEAIQTTIHRAD